LILEGAAFVTGLFLALGFPISTVTI
jgi:hypothetical protein